MDYIEESWTGSHCVGRLAYIVPTVRGQVSLTVKYCLNPLKGRLQHDWYEVVERGYRVVASVGHCRLD